MGRDVGFAGSDPRGLGFGRVIAMSRNKARGRALHGESRKEMLRGVKSIVCI